MKNQKLTRLLLVSAAMLGLAACSEQGELPTASDPNLPSAESGTRGPTLNSPLRFYSTKASGSERAAGELVARMLALALRDPAVGQEIKQALASSAVREHKLHLSSFLEGRGGSVLAAGYRDAGITQNQFQAAMEQLRQVEFYMPVEEHRAKWTGGSDVLVAISVSKGDPLIAFRTDGSRLELPVTSPPSTPMLVITHLETDFSDQVKINRRGLPALGCARNASESLEISAVRCQESVNITPNSGLTSVLGLHRDARVAVGNFIPAPHYNLATDPSNVGLYANFFRVLDAHESFFQGEPEVEVHVTGKRNGPAGAPIDYQCSGALAGDANGQQPGIRDFSYVFDMNGNFWSGDVRLLNAAQVDSLLIAEPDGFNVSLWEDDDQGPCNMREDHTGAWADAIAAAAAIARGVNAIRPESTFVNQQWGIIGGVINELANLIQGGDYPIGTLVIKDSVPEYAGQFPGNTHVIYDGSTFNGRATLYMKRIGRSASINGPHEMQPGENGTWIGSAGPASGTVNYTWSVDGGQPVQDGPNSEFSYTFSGTPFYLTLLARDNQGTIGGSEIYVTQCPDPRQIVCEPPGGGGNLSFPTSRPVDAGQPSASGKRAAGVRGGKK